MVSCVIPSPYDATLALHNLTFDQGFGIQNAKNFGGHRN
jgi:hypothetical protein